MKKSKGITIVEVMISSIIAIILIMSLYIVVYWGSDTNVVNQKIIEINAIMTYIQQDIINNSPLYFELDNNGNLVIRQDIDVNDMIIQRLRRVYGREMDLFVRGVRLVRLERVEKPEGIPVSYFDNIYRVTIEVVWLHKNRMKNYRTSFLVDSYNLKKLTTRQRLDENELEVFLPDINYDPRRVVLAPPGNDYSSVEGYDRHYPEGDR
ncbi:MAG: hypothetical protein RMJ51_05760 [Candidatus Calescibacterium sp.]|nr:hypothetical protein [Candidatus Calescibacterium sp.]MCX7972384.1 hypothetical protein [bacterium]MDW8195725.1 hypothetical protein [Candidatus Calescibacterium sp.]